MKYLLVILSIVFCFSCKTDKVSDYNNLDLLEHGMPISIKAPLDAKVTSDDLGVMKDVTVRSGDDYFVQILSSTAISLDAKAIKQTKLEEVKAGEFFSRIVEDYETGFIFEKKVGEKLNYDFRFIKIQGDNEFIFQTGLFGTFTEKDVRAMYKSVDIKK